MIRSLLPCSHSRREPPDAWSRRAGLHAVWRRGSFNSSVTLAILASLVAAAFFSCFRSQIAPSATGHSLRNRARFDESERSDSAPITLRATPSAPHHFANDRHHHRAEGAILLPRIDPRIGWFPDGGDVQVTTKRQVPISSRARLGLVVGLATVRGVGRSRCPSFPSPVPRRRSAWRVPSTPPCPPAPADLSRRRVRQAHRDLAALIDVDRRRRVPCATGAPRVIARKPPAAAAPHLCPIAL
jgi:hypothetical protein